MFKNFMRNSNGAAAIEYALLVSLIAVASMSSIETVGSALDAVFDLVASNLSQGLS